MEKIPVFSIIPEVSRGAHISQKLYQQLYRESVDRPEQFWAKLAAEFLSWEKPWDTVLEHDYARAHIRWFSGGKLNVSANCLDRHLRKRADKVALIWEGNEPGDTRHYTYSELTKEVCRFANMLKSVGVKRGDRVAIYLPMIPELMFSMLACARIGAVHSVTFAGFSADALRGRITDSACKILITANEGLRGPKAVQLKAIVDEAVLDCACIEKVLVVKRTNSPCPMQPSRDYWTEDLLKSASSECAPEIMEAEDPLFILYTSGSTGKPKGVLHTQAGYLLYASVTHKYVFDCREEDIYFCAADCGWITGHSYIVYGPLANGATTVMFESIPTYPDAGRYWDIVERHRVNIFYTAPTAIRTIAKEGDEFVKKYDRSSLRVLGTVGEPINHDAWMWYYNIVGEKRCAVVDTWWQTETGGIMISPLPGATALKPGSATLPFFGVQACLVDELGNELSGNNKKGLLCIKFPWPGQMRTVYGDHQRFFETYFAKFPGKYFTGDAALRDEDGYYWISGRVDDVLNVSGHRIGTAEIESAIVSSGIVAEAAVVGMAHDIKGQGIYAYCIAQNGVKAAAAAEQKVRDAVRKAIGPFAQPDAIQFVEGLPKTRSGKIMRRILRKIAEGVDDFGDVSTLADPAIVEAIADGARQLRRK